jgi:hypothetical protein
MNTTFDGLGCHDVDPYFLFVLFQVFSVDWERRERGDDISIL